MSRRPFKKLLLLTTFSSLLILSSCNLDSSLSSSSSENKEEQTESTLTTNSEETTSESIEISTESIESTLESTEPTIEDTEEITEEVSSTESSESSEEDIEQTYFIDDEFYREYAYHDYDLETYAPTSDPYTHIQTEYDRADFYNYNYHRATSYEDAVFRTRHGLISGDIKDTPENYSYDINHLPDRIYRNYATYRVNEGIYEYDQEGEFLSYTINNVDGKTKKIYYGAGYVTLEDVAAYLFAFAEAPANVHNNKNNNAQKAIINSWGEYGRVNNSYYSSDTMDYLYEPALPETDNGLGKDRNEHLDYFEMDFGFTQTPWGYGVESYEPYNNGYSITRGTVRFVYTARRQLDNKLGAKYIPLEDVMFS